MAIKQLYAGQYSHIPLDTSVCVADGTAQGARALYLITLKSSERDGLTGVKGSVLRHRIVDKTRTSLESRSPPSIGRSNSPCNAEVRLAAGWQPPIGWHIWGSHTIEKPADSRGFQSARVRHLSCKTTTRLCRRSIIVAVVESEFTAQDAAHAVDLLGDAGAIRLTASAVVTKSRARRCRAATRHDRRVQ